MLVFVALFIQQSYAQQPVNFKGAVYGEPSRGAGDNPYITFSEEYNLHKFAKAEDFSISWNLDSNVSIKSLFIVDLTSEEMPVLWKQESYNENHVKYDLIKDQLKVPFEKGHSYKLNILLTNRKSASYDFMIE